MVFVPLIEGTHKMAHRLLKIATVYFLLAVYLASVFGPRPPSAAAVAWSAEAMWLLVIWGYWIDQHRVPHRNS